MPNADDFREGLYKAIFSIWPPWRFCCRGASLPKSFTPVEIISVWQRGPVPAK
jgi:hypothetical protein